MKRSTIPVAIACAVAFSACAPLWSERAADAPPPWGPNEICWDWTVPDALPAHGYDVPDEPGRLADVCLRLNQVQVVGSHNSYHLRPREPLFSALAAFDPTLGIGFDYAHTPLGVQFADEAVRQIELDVFADPEGGRYATRVLEGELGMEPTGLPELEEPGFKVLHVLEVDYESTCWTLVQCLEHVKAWSDLRRNHLPIAILVELKTDPTPDPLGLGFVAPHPIGAAELDALDAEIRSVFPEERIITPDDVRGSYDTLEEAVLDRGWPLLGEARGKVMFLMDNAGSFRNLYRSGAPSLEGRVLFTNATPGAADAAFVKRNDPRGANTAQIADLVRQGYLVRTRADADTIQARTGDVSQRDAAFASGAQYVSTDYPEPGRAAPFGTGYVVQVPGPGPARCNPVNTGPACTDAGFAGRR